MYAYAGFMLACGFAAYAISGFAGRAVTALIVSGVIAFLMIICAVMSGKIQTNKPVGMIGIHVGMTLPLVFGVILGFMGYSRLTAEEPIVYLGTIMLIMSVGSLLSFGMILATRPKPEARG